MSDPIQPNSSISLPEGFRFGEVPSITPEPGIRAAAAAPADPPLGPLVAFVHEFVGNGFNTIFRPDSVQTPTKLPIDPPPPAAGIDNILELNLTTESLAFSQSLGTVPIGELLRRATSNSMASHTCRRSRTSPAVSASTLSPGCGWRYRKPALPPKAQRWCAWLRYRTAQRSRRRALPNRSLGSR